jgi:hypothetical protein
VLAFLKYRERNGSIYNLPLIASLKSSLSDSCSANLVKGVGIVDADGRGGPVFILLYLERH